MKNNKTRTLCEAAIFIAMAEILSFIKLYEFPNGGSVTLEMLPIILFAVRYGCGWGAGAGFVFGTVTYLIGNKFSIDWTTIICDYFLAFTALGLAGVFRGRRWGIFAGTVLGCAGRFLVHYVVGATIWAEYMPEEFLSMTMTSPWLYSLLYNGVYMLPNMVLALVIGALLYRPMGRYLTGADIE